MDSSKVVEHFRKVKSQKSTKYLVQRYNGYSR